MGLSREEKIGIIKGEIGIERLFKLLTRSAESAHDHLDIKSATEAAWQYDKSTRSTYKGKADDDETINPMNYGGLLADNWHKLNASQYRSGQDAKQMHDDAGFVWLLQKVEAFARCGVCEIFKVSYLCQLAHVVG